MPLLKQPNTPTYAHHPPAQAAAQQAGEEAKGKRRRLAPPGRRTAMQAERATQQARHGVGGPGSAARRGIGSIYAQGGLQGHSGAQQD